MGQPTSQWWNSLDKLSSSFVSRTFDMSEEQRQTHATSSPSGHDISSSTTRFCFDTSTVVSTHPDPDNEFHFSKWHTFFSAQVRLCPAGRCRGPGQIKGEGQAKKQHLKKLWGEVLPLFGALQTPATLVLVRTTALPNICGMLHSH